MCREFLNFNLGNAGTTRYACGGSGLPVILEVVQAARVSAAGPAEVRVAGTRPASTNANKPRAASIRRDTRMTPGPLGELRRPTESDCTEPGPRSRRQTALESCPAESTIPIAEA